MHQVKRGTDDGPHVVVNDNVRTSIRENLFYENRYRVLSVPRLNSIQNTFVAYQFKSYFDQVLIYGGLG
jgi:hypothetical protein